MAALTKTLLRDSIKREARIASTNDLDAMIYEIIDDVVADTFYKQRCFELLVIGAGTAMTNASPLITLPGDFQHVAEVRFSTDSLVTQTKLVQQNDFVENTLTGTPKFWKIVGATLYCFPYSLVLNTHKIYLDYFKAPTFAADGDVFQVFRLQAAVKKECLTRVLDYHKDVEQAQRMAASAESSLSRGMDANRIARGRDAKDLRAPNFETVPQDTE